MGGAGDGGSPSGLGDNASSNTGPMNSVASPSAVAVPGPQPQPATNAGTSNNYGYSGSSGTPSDPTDISTVHGYGHVSVVGDITGNAHVGGDSNGSVTVSGNSTSSGQVGGSSSGNGQASSGASSSTAASAPSPSQVAGITSTVLGQSATAANLANANAMAQQGGPAPSAKRPTGWKQRSARTPATTRRRAQ